VSIARELLSLRVWLDRWISPVKGGLSGPPQSALSVR
jgi:hypothetical protein